MTGKTDSAALRVAIVATPFAMLSAVLTLQDCLLVANYNAFRFGRSGRHFQASVVSAEPDAIVSYAGLKLDAVQPLPAADAVDLVLIPSGPPPILDQDAMATWVERNQPLQEWLLQVHAAGATIGSCCTGSLILAATGLLDHIPATTHWAMEQAAQALFPNVHWCLDEAVIEHGRVLTAGGYGMLSTLVPHLVRHYLGTDVAMETSRMLMMDPNSERHPAFRQGSLDVAYDNPRIETLKQYLAQNFRRALSLEDMALALSTTERTLTRVCQKELGMTPMQFLQRVRIEAVMSALQLTPAPVNRIVWDVGYEDVSTFQRLFKRHTGLTMSEYRRRFAVKIYGALGQDEVAFEA